MLKKASPFLWESLGTSKYLGIHSMIGRKRKEISIFCDRVWRKIQHWTSKHFPKDGKEVLIKSVAHAIPSYYISTFYFHLFFLMRLNK